MKLKLDLHHTCGRRFSTSEDFLAFVKSYILYDDYLIVHCGQDRTVQYIRTSPEDIPDGVRWIWDISCPHSQSWIAESSATREIADIRKRYQNGRHTKIIMVERFPSYDEVKVVGIYVSPSGDIASLIGLHWQSGTTTIRQIAETDYYNVQEHVLWLYRKLEVDYRTASEQGTDGHIHYIERYEQYWWETEAEYHVRKRKFDVLVREFEGIILFDDEKPYTPEQMMDVLQSPYNSCAEEHWCWEAFQLLTKAQQEVICQAVLTYHSLAESWRKIGN